MRSLLLIVLIALPAAPTGAAELYAAGKEIFRVNLDAAAIVAEGTLDAQATDLAPDPGGRYVAATTARGLTLLDPDTLVPTGALPLGVLDAVETSVTGDTLYVLLHPGGDRRRPTGAHVVLALPHDDLTGSYAVATLGSDSYDLFRSPDGRTLVVTRLVGRHLDVVDIATRRAHEVTVDDGRDRNQLAVLRSVAFVDSRVVVGESARQRALVLWEIALDGSEPLAHETDWVMHASDVVVAASHIVVNGRDQLARFDAASRAPIDRRDLHRDAWHAIADGAGTVYLAAPASDGARVMQLAPSTGAITETIALPARVVRLARRPEHAPPGTGRRP
jgi:hypothetical protein